ncbi:EGF-like repeat and discoidin I-like domain-containing protein 3 [Varanus komodoensis]|nr:EGF-like repeat and discoidin I-like domain-containing protein 3 [Varanus komodoensis]
MVTVQLCMGSTMVHEDIHEKGKSIHNLHAISVARKGPCNPNPCHNGGTCEISEAYRGDTFIGYACKCPEGFNGIHCQHSARRSNRSLLEEINPDCSLEGQILEDETQILWPPSEKEGLTGEEPNAGNNGGQKKKGMAEDEVARWSH